MTLTQKEHSLLCDLKSQEELCIEKYGKYSSEAHDPCLKNLFSSIRTTEESHLATIQRMMNGEEVEMSSESPSAKAAKTECPVASVSPEEKSADAYLCQDALAMEKHVSSVYNTSVFEFSSPNMRDTLAHIQKEEQNHGEQIYSYMKINGTYS